METRHEILPTPLQRPRSVFDFGRFKLTGNISYLPGMLHVRRQAVGHDQPHHAGLSERAPDVAVQLVGDGGVSSVSPLPRPWEKSLRMGGDMTRRDAMEIGWNGGPGGGGRGEGGKERAREGGGCGRTMRGRV